MLDIRATAYGSPESEVPFASVMLTARLVNYADETGLVTGGFRIYNSSTGLLIHQSDIIPIYVAAGDTVDVSALTDFDPPAPADDTYFVIFDGSASNSLVPDGIGIHLSKLVFDVKPAPLGPIPAGHHVTHEDTGIDEIDVTGLSGLLGDPQTPILHHLEHENGGSDEIDLDGLTGLDHHDLDGLADDDHPQYQEEDEKGVAGGYCGLPNPLNSALPLRADGTPARPTGLYLEFDFLNHGSADVYPWNSVAVGGGPSMTALAGEADHPGIYRVTSAPAANTGRCINLRIVSILIAGSERASFRIRPQTLANSTIRAGFGDTTTAAAPTDGCYLEMTTVALVPGTISGVCAAAGVSTATATSFVLVSNTWYKLTVEVNATATLVTFTVSSAAGAVLWSDTVNANIPTAAGQELAHEIIALSSGNVAIVDIDHFDFGINRPLIR